MFGFSTHQSIWTKFSRAMRYLKSRSFDFHENQCLFLKWTSTILRKELCWCQQASSQADLHTHKRLSRIHMAELVPENAAPCLGFMHRSCLCLGRGGCKQVGHIQRNRLFFFSFLSALWETSCGKRILFPEKCLRQIARWCLVIRTQMFLFSPTKGLLSLPQPILQL